jgi:hypothetical protein
VGARSIQYDAGQWDTFANGDPNPPQFPGTISNTGGTLDIDNFQLTFGVNPGVPAGDTLGTSTGILDSFFFQGNPTEYEFNWGSQIGVSGGNYSSDGISEQVIVTQTSTGFDVAFNFDQPSGDASSGVDVGCGSETDSLSIAGISGGGTTTYTAKGACGFSNPQSPNYNSLSYDFSVSNGIVAFAAPGWTSSTSGTTAAPEIDPASAFSGLSLLLGGFAVMRSSAKRGR